MLYLGFSQVDDLVFLEQREELKTVDIGLSSIVVLIGQMRCYLITSAIMVTDAD